MLPVTSPVTSVTSTEKPKINLREAMPLVTAFIDEMREAFGADVINRAIKNGMNGGCDFYASENGQEVGNKLPDSGYWVKGADIIIQTKESGLNQIQSRRKTQ